MINKSLSWKEWKEQNKKQPNRKQPNKKQSSKKQSNKKQPILLRPSGKDYLWGGNRLKAEYHKELPLTPLAETWECSTHPDGPSVVASGDYAGRTLTEVLALHSEWLGTHPKRMGINPESPGTYPKMPDTQPKRTNMFSENRGKNFQSGVLPVLIKFIDAEKDLSVQVHPNDAYALEKEGQPGKTEMWYVLDAKPGASLIFGFAQDMSREKIRQSLQEGRFMEYLQRIPVRKNDVFFIEPGTVHAIGGGVMVAEIQECSNVTYRVYDYDRVGKDGNPRQLHLQQALEVLKLTQEPEVRQQMRVMRYQPGSASESLCRCQYFQVDRVLVSSRFVCKVEATSFQVLLVLEGELEVRKFLTAEEQKPGEVSCATRKPKVEDVSGVENKLDELTVLHVRKGDCIFLPAACGEIEVLGRGQLLRVFC